MDKFDLSLYAVTDRAYLNGREIYEDIEKALKGGVTLLQLREKNMSFDELVLEAEKVKEICVKYNVPLIINDSIEAAKEAGADGVHLGQGDDSIKKAREILGCDAIIGKTARTVEQAIEAERDGASYIGSGAVFGTFTKADAKKMEIETLKSIVSAVSIPVAAIGGININNIVELKGTGIAGAAVVSGIFASDDIEQTSKILLERVKNL